MERIAPGKPRLDVRDLELVLAVAEAGSTTRAAARLHVTQSAVSRGLLLAEEKLGVRLFDRGARGISPTVAGQQLLQGAGEVLAHLVELERRVAMPAEATSEVRVVCECYTAYRWLPSALQSLARTTAQQGLHVTLSPKHTDEPVAALLAGEVDVALLTTSSVSGRLRDEALFSDEIVFVIARDHPLALRAALTTRDLTQSTIISNTATPEAERRWFFRKVFGKTKPKLKALSFPLTEAIMDAARAKMGIAVVSEWIASTYLANGDLIAKRLVTGPLWRPWRIAYREDSAAAARRLGSALGLHGAPPRVYAVSTGT